MKLLFENWRLYLAEAKQGPHQIYCDMDGVLVDFVAGAIKKINLDVNDKNMPSIDKDSNKLTSLGRLRNALKREDLSAIEEEHIEKYGPKASPLRKAAIKYMYISLAEDADFWASLPWMPGGKELWNTIKKYGPYILTAPMGKGSEEGKRRWIAKNLHPAPEQIYMSHDKFNWAMDDGQRNVLIDDFKTNVVPWRKNGGIAIHHDDEDMKNTLDKLTEIGFTVLRQPNEHTDDEPEEERSADDRED